MSERVPPLVRATLVAKGLTPPYVWAVLKAIRNRQEARPEPEREPPAPEPEAPREWEYIPEGWRYPAGGWNVEAITQAHHEKWPSFLEAVSGPGPLGINHEAPSGEAVPREAFEAQQTIIGFGYALALAARGGGSISLLDWGSGPGHYAVLARALLPGVEIDYHGRDLPGPVALGRELLPGDSFHDDDGCLDRTYDLVVASSTLQYAPGWRAALGRLAAATGGYCYVTRVPVALEAPSFVVLQRAHRYGYATEFLGWVLNRSELLDCAGEAGLELVRELLLPTWLSAEGAPEDPVGHRGFLFRPAGPLSRENGPDRRSG